MSTSFTENYVAATSTLYVEGSGTLGPLQTAKSTALKIEISGNFNIVSDLCFQDYVKVIEINLPDSIETIKGDIIRGCNSLINLTLGMNVKLIDEKEQSFDWTYALKNIFVDKSNNYFTDVDGVLYTKDLKKLCYVPGGRDETVFFVQYGVEIISPGAFGHSHVIQIIVIPPTIKTIMYYFAYSYDALSKIYIYQCENYIHFDKTAIFGGNSRPDVIFNYADQCVYVKRTPSKNKCVLNKSLMFVIAFSSS